jgi:N-acetylglutamate synthase-like GNAT family acetyltransferase
MNLTYRKATEADLEMIISLLLQDEHGIKRENNTKPLASRYFDIFEKIDKDLNQYLMVVESNQEIIATCHLSMMPSLTFVGTMRMQIEAVRVHDQYRGQGVGESMIRQAIKYGQKNGADIIQLTSNRVRSRAIKFYEKIGFISTHVGMKLIL